MLDLVQLFDSLPAGGESSGSGDSHFVAIRTPGLMLHRLAKDEQGSPALLVEVGNVSATTPAPIILEHLSVQHHVRCRVAYMDAPPEEARFTVIRYRGKDRELRKQFLQVLGPLVEAVGPAPSRVAVTDAIAHLVQLFRALSAAPRKAIQGLWAEVFLISRSSSLHIAAAAWHAEPEARYDFTLAAQHVEVKSYSGSERKHHFSLEQLAPPPGNAVLIASVLTIPVSSGTSLAQLLDRLRATLGDPGLMMHIDRVIAATLGDQLLAGLEACFNEQAAGESLAFYAAEDVPSVDPDIPSRVSDVRFRVDLSGQLPSDLDSFRAAGKLFGAVL